MNETSTAADERAAPLAVFVVVIVALVATAVLEPSIPTCLRRLPRLRIDISVAPVAGVLLLLALGELTPADVYDGIRGDNRGGTFNFDE